MQIHERILKVVQEYKRAEAELIQLLAEMDDCKGFIDLGYASLFSYVTRGLKLSENVAYNLITVSRKAREVPELRIAVESGALTVSKAKTVASVITPQNQEEWLKKAALAPTRDLERMVAEAQGKPSVRLTVHLEYSTAAALARVQELLSQRLGRKIDSAEAISLLAQDFIKRKDPVAKADRNTQNTRHVTSSLHSVHARDRGACQYRLPDGEICGARLYLHVHHKIPRSEGGTNAPDNLLTLCSAHHRLIHAH